MYPFLSKVLLKATEVEIVVNIQLHKANTLNDVLKHMRSSYILHVDTKLLIEQDNTSCSRSGRLIFEMQEKTIWIIFHK